MPDFLFYLERSSFSLGSPRSPSAAFVVAKMCNFRRRGPSPASLFSMETSCTFAFALWLAVQASRSRMRQRRRTHRWTPWYYRHRLGSRCCRRVRSCYGTCHCSVWRSILGRCPWPCTDCPGWSPEFLTSTICKSEKFAAHSSGKSARQCLLSTSSFTQSFCFLVFTFGQKY